MTLLFLSHLLLFSLSSGTFAALACVRPSEVGQRYFLYHGLGIAVLVGISQWVSGAPGVLGTGLFALGAGVFSFSHGRNPWISWPAFALASGGILLSMHSQVTAYLPESSIPFAIFYLSTFLSAMLLGFSMASMLLGHWYLVQPKLSINELGRVTLFFIALIAIRLLFGAVQLAPVISGKDEMELYRYFLGDTSGIFILMRWFWGLIAPAALGWFIWDTVRIRSTQSATGMLYVAVVFVLIGETMAQYLTFFRGIPG